MLFVAIIISAIVAGAVVYLCLRPQLVAVAELDKKTAEENQKLKEETIALRAERKSLVLQNNETVDQLEKLKISLEQMQKSAKNASEAYYNSNMKLVKEKLNHEIELSRQQFEDNLASFNKEYNETVSTFMAECKILSDQLIDLRAVAASAVEAAARAEQMREQQDYYRIKLSPEDIHEIEMLREVCPYLRDKEPLNKVIWKYYYEKPAAAMIGRVVGTETRTGIYKITEIETGKCYVGQALSISDRFRQHIKRGLGAETPTRNKLYPAMMAVGPENFTFEIIEECDRSKLNEKEDYWQDYFKAREFGYSIR